MNDEKSIGIITALLKCILTAWSDKLPVSETYENGRIPQPGETPFSQEHATNLDTLKKDIVAVFGL